eukprot:388338-Alexandrium_andersonii.AAC.1
MQHCVQRQGGLRWVGLLRSCRDWQRPPRGNLLELSTRLPPGQTVEFHLPSVAASLSWQRGQVDLMGAGRG